MKPNHCDFEFERIYHVYNRAVGKERLFTQSRNYDFFLRRYFQYLSDYVDTFAYCLLSNHFHILIRIKDEKTIAELVRERSDALQKSVASEGGEGEISCTKVISKQFHRLFTSYAKALNVQEKRNGGLFTRPFKRKEVDNENYFTYLIYYIHSNVVKHGLKKEYRDYPWSSYQELLSDLPTNLNRAEVMEWFGGRDWFIEYHETVDERLECPFIVED